MPYDENISAMRWRC